MLFYTLLGFLAVGSSVLVQRAIASGCCSKPSWKFSSTGHSNQTIDGRSFYVHIPSNYNSDTCVAHPVVLSFHGEGMNQKEQEIISGFSEDGLSINNTDIIAVYPLASWGPGKPGQGITTAWQGVPYANPDANDTAFVENIILALEQNLCIDPNRIYAAGKSIGGGFTNLLACTNSTSALFAAFATVSAALYQRTLPFDGCDPSVNIPMINFHGTADDIIPYDGQIASLDGNKSYALPNIPMWREAWATRDNCTNAHDPSITNLAPENTELYSWTCSLSGKRAVSIDGFTVDGLGHTWPNTKGLDGGNATFNATNQYIMPFFAAYALNNSFSYSTNSTPVGSGSKNSSQNATPNAASLLHATYTPFTLFIIALLSFSLT